MNTTPVGHIVSIVDGVVVLRDLGIVYQLVKPCLFFPAKMADEPGKLTLSDATKYALSRVGDEIGKLLIIRLRSTNAHNLIDFLLNFCTKHDKSMLHKI